MFHTPYQFLKFKPDSGKPKFRINFLTKIIQKHPFSPQGKNLLAYHNSHNNGVFFPPRVNQTELSIPVLVRTAAVVV